MTTNLAISYQSILIVPSTYTTTSVTLSLSHHGKLPRPFEQETQKGVSLRLQLVPGVAQKIIDKD